MIGCLGWGSLITKPAGLPHDGEWRRDGPSLPIEFARKSGLESGPRRLTLVIVQGAAETPTLWTRLRVATLNDAREVLRKRERTNLANIGFWPGGEAPSYGIDTWATERGLTALVWTALRSNFSAAGDIPSIEDVMSFIRSLRDDEVSDAKEYICTTPIQIRTAFRARLESHFGCNRS